MKRELTRKDFRIVKLTHWTNDGVPHEWHNFVVEQRFTAFGIFSFWQEIDFMRRTVEPTPLRFVTITEAEDAINRHLKASEYDPPKRKIIT